MKNRIKPLICCALVLALLCGCSSPVIEDLPIFHAAGDKNQPELLPQLPEAELRPVSELASENTLCAAVAYDSTVSMGTPALLERMEQPLLLCLDCAAVDISGEYSLEDVDILYADASVEASDNAEAFLEDVSEYAEDGGSLFYTDDLRDFFPEELTGVSSYTRLEALPSDAAYPDHGDDAAELQGIYKDFAELYAGFTRTEPVPVWVAEATDAVTLVSSGAGALCTVNCTEAGGYVLYAGGPAYTLLERGSDTALSTARLLENAFASFISKRTVGYSLWRVFGSFGRPSVSWQIAMEDVGAMESGVYETFARQLRDNGQIPSFVLGTNIYTSRSWQETVVCVTGISGTRPSEALSDSGSSAGTHVVADSSRLMLTQKDTGSAAYSQELSGMRAYPDVCDLNGDGVPDLLCGSSDGLLRFFSGVRYEDRLYTSEGIALTDAAGTVLSVGACSAPVTADLDGDGITDILCGASDGWLYWFKGDGTLSFEPMGQLLSTGLRGQALPAVGDVDGDGAADIVCGSDAGKLLLYRGTAGGFSPVGEELPLFGTGGDWLCPAITDIDGDGVTDIAVGTADGYIAKLLSDGRGGYASGGYYEATELNAAGSGNLQLPRHCVPRFADIDGDGLTDLICGGVEYGGVYAVDSGFFPFRELVAGTVKTQLDKGVYVGAKVFTGEYASAVREIRDFSSQISAVRQYYSAARGSFGVYMQGGVSSSQSVRQSFDSLAACSALWCGGYCAVTAESALSIPGLLYGDGGESLLLQGSSPILTNDRWAEICAGYDMPVCVPYSPGRDGSAAAVEKLSAVRDANNYNFVMENQAMLASAAAVNLRCDLVSNGSQSFDIELLPDYKSSSGQLYSQAYQSCCGARFCPGEALEGTIIRTDASVWYRDGSELYFSLDAVTRIYASQEDRDAPHLISVNLPAVVAADEAGATVAFREAGLMRCVVEGAAHTESDGWSTAEDAGRTVFTCYSTSARTLKIVYGE